MGGAFLLQIDHYKRINGYSNKYFGWGQEDDDMYERVNFVFKSVKHIDQKFGNVSAPAPALRPYPARLVRLPRICLLVARDGALAAARAYLLVGDASPYRHRVPACRSSRGRLTRQGEGVAVPRAQAWPCQGPRRHRC